MANESFGTIVHNGELEIKKEGEKGENLIMIVCTSNSCYKREICQRHHCNSGDKQDKSPAKSIYCCDYFFPIEGAKTTDYYEKAGWLGF